MSAIMGIFRLISMAISLYVFVCLVRVLITWFPNFRNSSFGRFLTQICDPYFSVFRNIRFLHIGNLDFTPALAIGVLILASGIFGQIADYGSFRIGMIFASIIQVFWSILSSIITFFNIIIAIRLVVSLLNKDYSSTIWVTLDNIIAPVRTYLNNLFFKTSSLSYKVSLAFTLGCCIVTQILGSILVGIIGTILVKIPF